MHNKKRSYFVYRAGIVLAAIAFLQYCAVRQGPPGGPEDKEPPQVVSIFPAPDSVNVRALDYIEITFDESLDRSSLFGQAWLLPELPDGIELEWKGNRKLRFNLGDSLDSDQTYIFTIGTGVKDLRGNRLAEPVLVPFSTGPSIDRGEISGSVLADKAEGTYIFAYPLDSDADPDTLLNMSPRYYTQVNKDGVYRLPYLKPLAYRVFALADENNDRQYTLQYDRIGLPTEDVVLDSLNFIRRQFNFSLTREDTTPPRLSSAKSESPYLVKVYFSEAIKPLKKGDLAVTDSAGGQKLPVLHYQLEKKDRSILRLYTEQQKAVEYAVSIRGLEDTLGIRQLQPARTTFKGKEKKNADTTRAKLIATLPADGARRISLKTEIALEFDQPVDSTSMVRAFSIMGPDSLPATGSWQMDDRLVPRFRPDSSVYGATYRYRLNGGQLKTLYGKSFQDTLYARSYTTRSLDEMGEVAGRIQTTDTSALSAIYQLVPFAGGEQISTGVTMNAGYLLANVPDGTYRLRLIVDRNENGRFDRGASRPFVFAEPLFIYPDTVRVRKRWTTEGINLIISEH